VAYDIGKDEELAQKMEGGIIEGGDPSEIYTEAFLSGEDAGLCEEIEPEEIEPGEELIYLEEEEGEEKEEEKEGEGEELTQDVMLMRERKKRRRRRERERSLPKTLCL